MPAQRRASSIAVEGLRRRGDQGHLTGTPKASTRAEAARSMPPSIIAAPTGDAEALGTSRARSTRLPAAATTVSRVTARYRDPEVGAASPSRPPRGPDRARLHRR